MRKPPTALLWLLLLLAAAPLPALTIQSPFRPFGPVDPALLLPAGGVPVPIEVAGRVVDPAGEPVPGAEVILRSIYPGDEAFVIYQDYNPARHTRSDPHGFFQFPGADPRPWATLEVSAPGFAAASFELGNLSEGHFQEVFVLQRGGGLRFTVVDPQGEVLPEARAVVVTERDVWTLGMYLLMDPTTPDALVVSRGDGLFMIDSLVAGVSSLMVLAPGYRTRIVPVDLPPGGKLDLGKLAMEPAQRVKGRVVDAGGDPVAEATVQLQLVAGTREAPEYVSGEMQVTDEKGLFELWASPPEGFALSLVATATGRGHRRFDFTEPPRQTVELRLGERRPIYGRVVMAVDRSPVFECNLYTTLAGSDGGVEESENVFTDENGYFEMPTAPLGPFTIFFTCAGKSQSVDVAAEADLPLLLEVETGTFVRGRVIREEATAEDISAVLSHPSFTAWTEPDGTFTAEGIEPGEGQLLVEAGEQSFLMPLTVPAEGLENLEIQLPKAEKLRRLEGIVYEPNGRPASQAWVQVYSADGTLVCTTSVKPDGTFRTNALEPGEVQVIAQWMLLNLGAKVEIGDEDAKIELAFPPGTTVSGRVGGFEPAEASLLFLRATRSRAIVGDMMLEEQVTAKIDLEGNFVIENVPEGEWNLTAGIVARHLQATTTVEVGKRPEHVDLELADE